MVDPEGEWLELDDLVNRLDGRPERFANPAFEEGLLGWKDDGNVTEEPVGIVGKSARVGSDSRLSQALDLAGDLENTRYIVRSNVRGVSGSGSAVMTLQWLNGVGQLVGEVLPSNKVTVAEGLEEFRMDAVKPVSADSLRIEYAVEGGGVFLFDNTSVVRRGADEPIENGDFSKGDQFWELGGGAKIEPHPEDSDVMALRMMRKSGQTGTQPVKRTFEEVASDPLGTRYIYRFDVSTTAPDNFTFLVHVNVNSTEKGIKRDSVAHVVAGAQGEVSFTLRKRPNDVSHDLTFEMKRKTDEEDTSEARVYISDFRLDKERLFDEAECVADSPTGCLPHG